MVKNVRLDEIYHDREPQYPIGAVVYDVNYLPFKNVPLDYFCIFWIISIECIDKFLSNKH